MRIQTGARVVLSLVTAAAVVGVSAEAVAADRVGAAVGATSYSTRGTLLDVAAGPAGSAWAVGHTGSICNPRALILRWTGTAWKRMPGPRPAGSGLDGVAVGSARSAWAVGYTGGNV